jgi:hypothetical protein
MTAELERISKKEVVFWGNIPEFSWSEWQKPLKSLSEESDVPPEIRIEDFPNANLKLYQYISLHCY